MLLNAQYVISEGPYQNKVQHLLSVVWEKPSGAGHCVLWLTSIWLMYSIVIKTKNY